MMAGNTPNNYQGHVEQPVSGNNGRLHAENQRLKRRLASKEQEIQRQREKYRALESRMMRWYSNRYQYNLAQWDHTTHIASARYYYLPPLDTELSNYTAEVEAARYDYRSRFETEQSDYTVLETDLMNIVLIGIEQRVTNPTRGRRMYYYVKQPGMSSYLVYCYHIQRGWREVFIDWTYFFGQVLILFLKDFSRMFGQAVTGLPYFIGQTVRWSLRVCLVVGIPVGLVLLYFNISPDVRYAMHDKLQLYISMAMNKIRVVVERNNSALDYNTTV